MLENGYIKLYRSLTSWEWYDEPNTLRVFLHLLLTVNYENRKHKGKVIKKGSRLVTSDDLEKELNLTTQNIRTALKNLQKSENLTVLKCGRSRIIAINNYDKFQQLTGSQQNANNILTGSQQRANSKGRKIKKDKESKRKDIYVEIISYLNEKAGTNYKPTVKTTQEHINARLSEGFTLEDFKKVIDNKVFDWASDEKMRQYIRPQTLFCTKFEGYLNQGGKENANTTTGENDPWSRIGTTV